MKRELEEKEERSQGTRSKLREKEQAILNLDDHEGTKGKDGARVHRCQFNSECRARR